jgi:hypothetical protein
MVITADGGFVEIKQGELKRLLMYCKIALQ